MRDIIIKHLTEVARRWTQIWNYSITQNFILGGRPKWVKTRRGGKILQKSNRMHSSIAVRLSENDTKFTFIASTGVKYGRIHQYGGWIKPKNAKALTIPISKQAQGKSPWKTLFLHKTKKGAFLSERKGNKIVNHFVLKKAVYIPARPYLVVQDADEQDFRKLLVEGTGRSIAESLRKLDVRNR
jgi:phage gpG-like protein